MFGSNILDVGIGLVFLFLLLSLICSSANELIEGIIKKRAKDLECGIKELVGSGGDKKFVERIYDHGLVNSLFRGSYSTAPRRRLPSYIPSRNFALALLSIAKDPTVATSLPQNVRSALDTFEKAASNDPIELQKSVEDWYNSTMDRVSGWYKRRTQIFIFVLGAILAVYLNVDCIEYATRLSKDSSLRQSVVAMAQAYAKQDQNDQKGDPVEKIQANIKSLDGVGLPIGWNEADKKDMIKAVKAHSLGWLLTALAVSLGAPFWFDTLNRLMVVRSTVKPHEKSDEESSKDPKRTRTR
jgi:hypothetical protein